MFEFQKVLYCGLKVYYTFFLCNKFYNKDGLFMFKLILHFLHYIVVVVVVVVVIKFGSSSNLRNIKRICMGKS